MAKKACSLSCQGVNHAVSSDPTFGRLKTEAPSLESCGRYTHSLFAVDLDTAISDIVSIDCLHSYSQDQRKLYDFV